MIRELRRRTGRPVQYRIKDSSGKGFHIGPSRLCVAGYWTAVRRGFTILELLVTSGMIFMLAALLVPAVMSARESARRIECTHHLRQIGLALHQYHDAHNCLPAAWQNETSGQSAYSWATAIQPFLDQQTRSESIEKRLSIGDPRNNDLRATTLRNFLCPSDVAPATFELFEPAASTPFLSLPSANYVGVYGTSEPDDIHPTPAGDGTFINNKPVRFHEIQRGLSNVLLVGERSAALFSSSWLGFDRRDEDAECRVVGGAIEGPNCQSCDECEFSSRHAEMSNFLFADGHVRGIANSIDQTLYRQMARRQE